MLHLNPNPNLFKKLYINNIQKFGLCLQANRRVATAAGGQSIPWSPEEERLLCAIVHEFGSNWFLVADVLATSCAMQGIYRSPGSCRYRFRAITVSVALCLVVSRHAFKGMSQCEGSLGCNVLI